MADRVAIFNEGRIVQAGTPEEIYEQPRVKFVADFVGSSNVLPPAFSRKAGGPAKWTSLRPERISIGQGTGASVLARVNSVHYQGAVTRIVADADGQRIAASVPAGGLRIAEGENISLHWPLAAMHAMDDG
jgi:putative spermidine/putrescine transport system ATP-binding protein